MIKATIVPKELMGAPNYQRFIAVEGINIIESCAHAREQNGSMLLKDHMLLFVLKGTNVITHGKNSYTVKEHQMVLLKKNSGISYHKTGHKGDNNFYDSMMFFLKDEFLTEFIKTTNLKTAGGTIATDVTVKDVKEPLLSFIVSIKPHFNNPEQVDKGLVRIKIMELLYDLASTDKDLLAQLLQLKKQAVTDITRVIEDNYMNPLKLEEFAYLSGRSLASFKRDFNTIYDVSPAQFIKEKRLAKAKDLLETTDWPVQDICFSTGFESMSHFSRLFRIYTSYTPSDYRGQKRNLLIKHSATPPFRRI